jgi:hypothetical protein
MKRSRAYKSYPDWRQRESRMLIWALAVGCIAAAAMTVVIYLVNHRGAY